MDDLYRPWSARTGKARSRVREEGKQLQLGRPMVRARPNSPLLHGELNGYVELMSYL